LALKKYHTIKEFKLQKTDIGERVRITLNKNRFTFLPKSFGQELIESLRRATSVDLYEPQKLTQSALYLSKLNNVGTKFEYPHCKIINCAPGMLNDDDDDDDDDDNDDDEAVIQAADYDDDDDVDDDIIIKPKSPMKKQNFNIIYDTQIID
jgi:hypothetical protein